MQGDFSQETISWLFETYPEVMIGNFYDFTSCQRPNGTIYGTAGTCRKGKEIEQRREESIKHLNNSISLLKEKRGTLPEGGKGRINRLISKLEGDLRVVSGPQASQNKSPSARSTSGARSEDLSRMKPEKTRNEGYGFYGTTREIHSSEVDNRWEQTSKAIQSQGIKPIFARRLLDSSWGRHLADEIERVPTEQVNQKVRQFLEKQTPFSRREFKNLLKEVTSEGYDD